MWVNSTLSVLASPFEVLHPMYSRGEHGLSFKISRPCEVVSAAKFECGIKGQNMYLGLSNIFEGE